MDIDELLAPLSAETPQAGWREPDRLRAVVRARRRTRRVTAAAAAVIALAGGTLVAVRASSDAADGRRYPAGAVQLAAKIDPLPTRDQDAVRAVVTAEQQFTVDLLRRGAVGQNSVSSPASLALALAMLQNGARGVTAAQIATVLHTSGLPAQQQDAGWAALVTDLAAARGVTLQSANSLWTQRGLTVQPAFLAALARYFRTGVWQVDFYGDTAGAQRAINAWTSDRTHGKITKLFDQLDPDTLLVLTDAIYFEAAWATSFDPTLTANAPFHQLTGGEVSVPFMHANSGVSDNVTRTWQSVRIPYAGGRYSAVLVMPTRGTLAGLVDSLTPSLLRRFADTRDDGDARLAVPKFTLSTYANLIPALSRLGMTRAFDPDAADFSGISPTAMYVKQIVQRDYLSIDEHGTEAAGATGIAAEGSSARRGPTLQPFDHPFLFLIRDDRTGALMFSAQIYRPTS